MSHANPTTSSSPDFQLIFNNALEAYRKRTRKDLLTHPLFTQLQNCNSPSDVLTLINQQLRGLHQSQREDGRLTRWLDPTVRVLYAFSETLGEGVSLTFSPAKVIFVGAGVLLSAAMDVRASQDNLIDVFERMESFFQRLEVCTRVSPPLEMIDIIVKIMVEVLSILGISMKEMKQGRIKKYLKKLIGKAGIEDALMRLDKLTNEGVRMVTAQVPKATHTVHESMARVDEGAARVDGRVVSMDDRVAHVDESTAGVEDRVASVDDKVKVVDNNVAVGIDEGKDSRAAIQRVADNTYHFRPSPNGYQNQPYTPTPFVRSEGFITKMFGRRDAAFFIESLLKVDARDVYLVGNVPGWHNALMTQKPSVNDARIGAYGPNSQPLWLLDILPPPMYHVVPQKIWTPPNQSDWRRYVEQANLRMPVFFIQNDGTIGLPLARALAGDRTSLRSADIAAPLGGGHSTQIRIAWPGYESWERQIQIRDQTRLRNEITLERFVKLVAGVVDRFLTNASSIPPPDTPWRVGHEGITRNNVIIVGTVQVSAGGWMPILQSNNPVAAPSTQYYPVHA